MSSCPVCNDNNDKIFRARTALAYGDNFDLVTCSACRVSCLFPLPSNAQLRKFYTNSYYSFDKYRDEFRGRVYARKLKKLGETGNFLDIGCSTGHFIKGVRDNCAWKVYGTEFSNPAVKYAKEKLGLDVRSGELNENGFEQEYFDYIHVNNVMEHVLDPVKLLREANRILKPGGIFQLMLPNGSVDQLPLIKYFNEENKPAKTKDGHIYFFPKTALIQLLAKQGFVMESSKTCSIRKGLKILGCFPLKKNWKDIYISHPEKPDTRIFNPVEVKKHSNLYYGYRYFMNNAQDLPGMWGFGQDFLLIAKKEVKNK